MLLVETIMSETIARLCVLRAEGNLYAFTRHADIDYGWARKLITGEVKHPSIYRVANLVNALDTWDARHA